MNIEELLEMTVKEGASDLHLSAGLSPVIRVSGALRRTDYPVLSAGELNSMLFSMLNNEQRRILEQTWELDLSYGIRGLGRFRINIYKDKGSYAAAFRSISTDLPKFEELGLHPIVKKITERPRGLILVTGPTGSGKSTTLACMIDHINETRSEHILIIEDPTEFIHKSKKSIVHQRELGQDTRSFANALKSALREDPDIILVGEMRDLETISLALTAAETGHLVMGTLHTSSASQTVNRILDVFPEMQQQQIKVQLASCLIAVFSQTLLPSKMPCGKYGRVMAQEVMVVNPAISNLIREGKTAQIYSAIQTGAQYGMQTLESSLAQLCNEGKITEEEALSKSQRPDEFKRLAGCCDNNRY